MVESIVTRGGPSGASRSTLTSLLMPSGPQWSEMWVLSSVRPPAVAHYDWHHYTIGWRPYVGDRVREWPDGAWVCDLTGGPACERRKFCERGSCVPMSWRFAIGPDLKSWEAGDPQPQDGHWPIFIAVFG